MNRFLLVRHGKTLNNEAKRLSGWIDTPLTDDGLGQTHIAIAKLKGIDIAAVYASDLGRAFITAYEICSKLKLGHEIVRVPDLREVNYGDAGNMRSEEAYKLYPRLDRDTRYVPPNGESLQNMQTRAVRSVVEIDAVHTDETILLVAHSGVMAALNASRQRIDFGAHNISEAYPHDYVAEFTVSEGTVASFNEFGSH